MCVLFVCTTGIILQYIYCSATCFSQLIISQGHLFWILIGLLSTSILLIFFYLFYFGVGSTFTWFRNQNYIIGMYFLIPIPVLFLFHSFPPTPLYGQTTQDGCSLALWKSPARPVPVSPTHYSRDYPILLIIGLNHLCVCPLPQPLVSLVTDEPTWHQLHYKW